MKTTSTKLPTDYVEILKPALPRVSVTVAEEASTDGATNKQCVDEVLDNKKATTTKVCMDFLEIPQRRLREDSWHWPRRPGTFLLKMSIVLPQLTGMTRRVIEPVSWGRLFESLAS